MDIAMFVSTDAAWQDGLVLGPAAVGGWTEQELCDARREAFIQQVRYLDLTVSGGKVADGDLLVLDRDGFACARVEDRIVRVARLQGDLGAVEVAEALLGRLGRVRRWLYDMRRASQSGDVARLMQVARGLVGRSLVLFDGAFNLVGASLVPGEHSAAMEETERRGYAADVSAEHQARYRELCAQCPEGFMTAYPERGDETPVWSQPVAVGAETFRLHVMNATPGDVGTAALAHCVAGQLEGPLKRRAPISGKSLETDFVTELTARRHTEEETLARARFFGWSTEGPWVAVRLEGANESFPLARWRQIAVRVCDVPFEVHTSVSDEEGLVAIMCTRSRPGWREALRKACLADGLVGGAGDPVECLAEVSTSSQQALRACALARSGGRGSLLSYDECRYRLACRSLREAFGELELEPTALREMRHRDRQTGSDYVATVRAYLGCNMVKAAACERLHIHRTTLDYRLRRLAEEFGLDFADEQTTTLLRLALLAEG